MKITNVFLVVFALFSISCNTQNKKEKKTAKRPNILFIMTDDHAIRAISKYDGSLNSTPNIDRIANEGVFFKNSFVTNSICGPSRATMLTGKFSHLNGLKKNDGTLFNGSQPTYPNILQKHGYQTAVIGKWHLHSDPVGFDHWEILPGQGKYYNPDFYGKDDPVVEKKNKRGKVKKHHSTHRVMGYATDIITDKAIEWIDNRDKEKPFCLLLHHKAPHRTWDPKAEYFAEFANKTYPLPETMFEEYKSTARRESRTHFMPNDDMCLNYDLKMAKVPEQRFKDYDKKRLSRFTKEEKKAWNAHYDTIRDNYLAKLKKGMSAREHAIFKYQRYMRDYLACIQSVDDNIGRTLAYLEKEGLLDNTLVVYTSDQGFNTGEHGFYDKRFMYEETFRTPLMMRFPKGYKSGVVVDEMVQNIDYAATFLDIAGVEKHKAFQGESLLPFATENKPTDWRKSLYYHYYEYPNEHMVKKHYGVRTDRYKLIHFYKDIDEWELYDLKEDPNEMNNIYNDPKNSDLIKELKAELEKLQIQYKDTDKSTY